MGPARTRPRGRASELLVRMVEALLRGRVIEFHRSRTGGRHSPWVFELRVDGSKLGIHFAEGALKFTVSEAVRDGISLRRTSEGHWIICRPRIPLRRVTRQEANSGEG
jgi:hypothetical protein